MIERLYLLLRNVKKCYLLNSVEPVFQLTHQNPDLELDSLTHSHHFKKSEHCDFPVTSLVNRRSLSREVRKPL